jgi:hypothetical protein
MLRQARAGDARSPLQRQDAIRSLLAHSLERPDCSITSLPARKIDAQRCGVAATNTPKMVRELFPVRDEQTYRIEVPLADPFAEMALPNAIAVTNVPDRPHIFGTRFVCSTGYLPRAPRGRASEHSRRVKEQRTLGNLGVHSRGEPGREPSAKVPRRKTFRGQRSGEVIPHRFPAERGGNCFVL